MAEEEYVRNLESIIQQMLKPLRNLPFDLVIQSISGHRIIPFDHDNEHDVSLLTSLRNAVSAACQLINENGIIRRRANEVGNDIEHFVSGALVDQGLRCAKPVTQSGKAQAAGYPDLMITDQFGRDQYIECKTFSEESLNTTFRSFYVSPSEQFKVTRDAHHFAVCYQIEVLRQSGGNNVYGCLGWKILDLSQLQVDVKYEFNSDNRRLYAQRLVLAQGVAQA